MHHPHSVRVGGLVGRSSLICFVVAATGLVFAAATASAQGNARPPTPVEVAETRTSAMASRLIAVGSLRSNESVIIRSEIAGRIKSINFDEGQPIERGQLLLTLDDSIPAAEVTRAEAQLRLAERNMERTAELYAKKIATPQARDEGQSKAQIAAADLALAQARLEKTRIMAPFAGIMGLRKVSLGDFIAIGQDIAGLENIDPIKVDFRIPEKFLATIKNQQLIKVQVDAYAGREFNGKVFAIDPRIDAAGRSIIVRAVLPNGERLLRPGLFARVNLVFDEKPNALTVPEGAIVPRGREHFVYRVVEGKAREVKINIGLRRNGRVEITQGLSKGDKVVTAGHLKIRDGAAVKIVASVEGA